MKLGAGAAALALGASVGAAEGAARRFGWPLPELRLWHDPVAQLKVAQMDDRRRKGETGGVVFAGSSQILEGVLPSVAAPGLGRRAYNAALHRGFLPLTEPWLLEEVLPRLRPALVVFGLGLLDLTDNGIAQYEVLDRFQSSWARRRDTPARLLRASVARSALLRHALAPLGPTVAFRDVRIGPEGEGLEFADATEYRLSKKKRAYIEDELLADYETGPRSAAAIRRVVDGVRSCGADLVLVRLPHTDEIVEMLPGGASRVAGSDDVLRRVAGEVNAPLLEDLAGLRDHRWFADCIHLNGAGMRHASGILARALAPWLAGMSA